MSCAKSDEKVIEELLKKKNETIPQVNLGDLTNLMGTKKKEIEPDTDVANEQDIVDDSYLY